MMPLGYRANFITNGNCRFWYILIIGTLLVKITDENAKEAQVQKALNIGNWVSIGLTAIACYFSSIYVATMKMEFFWRRHISSMRVFMLRLLDLVGAVISSVTEYYTGLGQNQ
jgi:K(+)-stimulated pyrophosphate-energized sodium pump